MKGLSSLEILGVLSGTTSWSALASLIPERASLLGHAKVAPHSDLRGLLPVNDLLKSSLLS